MKKLALVLVTLLALMTLSPGALADLRRGDSGSDVKDLQTMLFQSGFLFEEPDGLFGARTEDAVKRYQAFAEIPQTGVADGETIARLTETWMALLGYEPGWDEGDPPVYCVVWEGDHGMDVTEYCGAHQDLRQRANALTTDGTAEGWRAASDLWRDEVEALYDEWLSLADADEQGVVLAARAAFLSGVEVQRSALSAWYARHTDFDSAVFTEMEIQRTLRVHAAWLCRILHEDMEFNG